MPNTTFPPELLSYMGIKGTTAGGGYGPHGRRTAPRVNKPSTTSGTTPPGQTTGIINQPIVCPTCGQQFPDDISFSRHMTTAHPPQNTSVVSGAQNPVLNRVAGQFQQAPGAGMGGVVSGGQAPWMTRWLTQPATGGLDNYLTQYLASLFMTPRRY